MGIERVVAKAGQEQAREMYTKDQRGGSGLFGTLLTYYLIDRLFSRVRRARSRRSDTPQQLNEITVAKLASDGPVQIELPPGTPVIVSGQGSAGQVEALAPMVNNFNSYAETASKAASEQQAATEKTNVLMAALLGETVEQHRQEWIRNRRLDREAKKDADIYGRKNAAGPVVRKVTEAKAKAAETAGGLASSLTSAVGGTVIGGAALKAGKGVLSVGGKLLGMGAKAAMPLATGLAARGGLVGVGSKIGGTALKAAGGLLLRHPAAALLTAAGIGGYSWLMGKLPNGGKEQDWLTSAFGLGMMDDKGGLSSALWTSGTWAATGATIGSFIPVIGTAAGAATGAVVGGLVGWLGKDWWKSWFSDPEGATETAAKKVDTVLKNSLEAKTAESIKRYQDYLVGGEGAQVAPSVAMSETMANRTYGGTVESKATEMSVAGKMVANAMAVNNVNNTNVTNSIALRTRPINSDETAQRVRSLLSGVR